MNEPTWEPCVKRQTVIKVQPDGTETPLMRCTHQACSRFTKNVTPEDCAGCPLRVFTPAIRPPGYTEMQINVRDFGEPRILPDGTLVYPKTGFEPPIEPEGYKRLSEDIKSEAAWVFTPIWPKCRGREMANTVRPCGCITINALCAVEESTFFGRKVTVSNCHDCPVRLAPDSE